MTRQAQTKDRSEKITAALNKAFGAGTAQLMREREETPVREVIPTGLDVIDHYLCPIGGLPVGRIVELYSEEGVGKTALGHHFLGAAQAAGGEAILIETEYAFDEERAETFGVNLDNLIFLQPDHVEDCLKAIETTLAMLQSTNAPPSIIVWDSIAATPSQAEFMTGLSGKQGMGQERAKALSKAMRILMRRVKESRAVLVCINQIRDKIGVMFGDKYTTGGGHAVKFAASVRFQVFAGKSVKKLTEHVGRSTTLLCTKNRLAPPYRKARLMINFSEGWNDRWSTLDFAKERKLIDPRSRGAAAHKIALEKLGWPVKDTSDKPDEDLEEIDETED